MAVMLISSDDPKFSFHLKKNPNSVVACKKMRQGAVMGWYPNCDYQKYALFFKDNTHNSSFSNEGKNFTDMTRYVSTYFVFHSISTMFSSVLKLDSTQASHTHSIQIPTVQMRNGKTIDFLNTFLGLDLNVTKLSEDIDSMALYSVDIKYTGAFNEFMMKTYILFYLLHADLFQSDLGYMEGMIEKVTNILVELKSEYFLWYMFNKNVICRHTTFKKLQSTLGKGSIDGDNIVMQYGGTQQQRKSYIDSHLDFTKDIVDIGCGEGYYLLPYAKKMRDGKTITGIDVDTKLIGNIQNKIEDRKQEDKVKLYTSMDDVYKSGDTNLKDVICVEVIEHMPVEDATELVHNALVKINFDKFIITTPNRSFNQFYKTMTGFRHDDHHFEFDTKEFEDFITNILINCWKGDKFDKYWDVKFEGVGDCVDGIYMSQSAVITNKKILD